MLWKRLAPLVLAVALLATALGAASRGGLAPECWPRPAHPVTL